ncbi:MAG: hypothetical protein JXR76_28540 [Deltaproteobacteria bacterium]|nr:hypothetical protein [Deltaproteobacteria bacterium]
MKIQYLLVAVLFLIFGCISCSKYTYITSKQARVHKGARVAVVVWDNVSEESPSLLNDYLIAALTQKGHTVTVFNPNYLLGDDMSLFLYPEGEYAAGRAIAEGLRQGGKITGDAKELQQTVLNRTEVSDAIMRYNQLDHLKRRLKQSGIDHLLIVRRFDFFGFSAQVLELKDFRIISSLTFQGNDIGFEKVVARHNLGTKGAYAQTGDVSRLELLQMASLIASGL